MSSWGRARTSSLTGGAGATGTGTLTVMPADRDEPGSNDEAPFPTGVVGASDEATVGDGSSESDESPVGDGATASRGARGRKARRSDATAVQDDPSDDSGVDLAPSSPAGAGGSRWNNWVIDNFSASARLKARDARRAPSNSEVVRTAVNGLEPTELRVGIFAVVAEIALTLLIYFFTHGHHFATRALRLNAVHAAQIFLIEGAILAVGLVLGILVRRRALLGFASLLVGVWLIQISALAVLGIAYLGFGLWLVVRALKYTNKDGKASERAEAAQAARDARAAKRSGSKRSPYKAQRGAPTANKRYTPPKPSKRPPPAKVTTPKASGRSR